MPNPSNPVPASEPTTPRLCPLKSQRGTSARNSRGCHSLARLSLGLGLASLALFPSPLTERTLFAATPSAKAQTGKITAGEPDAAGLEFFEKHIRPVLVERCYECHGPEVEKPKGSLRLDTRDGLLQGGASGPALLPGHPEKSLLLSAVRHTDEHLQMPKKGPKLTEPQIEDLAAWIKMGAPDPRKASGAVKGKAGSGPSPATHWAFQPVREPPVPKVRNRQLVRTPIDNFLLARLEEKGLTLAPPADKRTLLRRASYDLTGLPPTREEVQAFAVDDSPEAFARVVDRLLDSPRYGERWGRYWLDVARYSDTKGYVFEEERRYPYSYTYRDWVVRALNENLPYDQFLIQQLAADLQPLGEDKRPLAALGFLTLGRRFLNSQPDIIDDRIDVVMRGTMGLTVGCARCHDHKFDPIPTKDYYSLYGVFASSHEPGELPLLGSASLPPEYNAYVEERKKRQQELDEYLENSLEEVRTRLRSQVGDYLLALHDSELTAEDKREGLIRERKLQPPAFRQFKRAAADWQKKSPGIFGPWFALAAQPASNFMAAARAWQENPAAAGKLEAPLNPLVKDLLTTNPAPASLRELADRYNSLFSSMEGEGRRMETNVPAPKRLPEEPREAIRQILHGSGSPILALSGDELQGLTDTPVQQKLRALKRKLDELDATHAGAPPRAMALLDNASPTEPVVFRRGNPGNPGDKVPRQFLEIVAGPNRKPFTQGSGRMEMARAIASPDNPLTARVFVNRAWLHHFGTPLVRTPSDFGLRSDPPTHPQLLDYLASRFVAEGWSMKKLHRLILLSSAYQQSSLDSPKASKIDPGNQLFWRMNRQRLDFEAMRDTLLAVSGKLDPTLGGRGVDITTEPFTGRRTVYGFVERQNLPGLFRTFDFASPDTTSPQRFSTTVPQQALFLMNSPFVVELARRLAQRPELRQASSEDEKIRRLYQIAFQRQPDADEIALARGFLQDQAGPPEEEPYAWSYGYGRFEDATERVAGFTALPYWTGYAWQGGTNLPDPKLGWVILNAEGGHVGNDANHAAIRRWRAPRDGMIRINGRLNHPSDQGDGVRGRIVSSERGLLAQWTATHQEVGTSLDRVSVKRGEFIDFVTDCRQSVEFDSFHWSPSITMVSSPAEAPADAPMTWSAQAEFSGPIKPKERKPLTHWEKYAQVLLLANELAFVD